MRREKEAAIERQDFPDLRRAALHMWPGVRRAGLPKAEPGAPRASGAARRGRDS